MLNPITAYNEMETHFMEKKKTNQEIIDQYDYLTHAASSQDCTGLIPTPPLDPQAIESYEQIYPFLPPKLNNSYKND